MPLPGTPYFVEVHAHIPPELSRLTELASNLWYSWDRATRDCFRRMHVELWEDCGQSPRAFLRRIDERRLLAFAQDEDFMRNYRRVLSTFDAYIASNAARPGVAALGPQHLVAYFCAEFGFHESLPIYSGGLGILAGDHCKSASDLRLSLVGVGLALSGRLLPPDDRRRRSPEREYATRISRDLPITRCTARRQRAP